jgi:hypothetical protein
MAKSRVAQTAQTKPLAIVGSSKYGRYPELSVEKTLNMLISDKGEDGGLVPFPGYKFRLALGGNGRGIYSSIKADLMFTVFDQNLYQIQPTLAPALIGTLATNHGDVFISEDILNNIAICDKQKLYIYNYNLGIFYIPGTTPYGGTSALTITQSGTTVTGIGTMFTAAMVGGTIYFGGNLSATITAFGSTTSLTVSLSQTISVAQQFLITQPLDFIPNYVTFQDGRFICTSTLTTTGNDIGQWRLSGLSTITVGTVTTSYITFPATPQKTGLFQSKADAPIAAVRLPGRGNLLLVMGSIVTEPWTDLGLALFPYQKNTSYNIDYGTINSATIAYLDNTVAWLGFNERAGIVLMYTTGQDVKTISTDGINYQLANVVNPEMCYGMSFKIDGHLIYMFTFFGPSDNFSLAYDFTTEGFFDVTDQNLNYHIAKRVVFFNNTYYFISINDGNLYEINSLFTNFSYQPLTPGGALQMFDMPMGRTTPNFDMPNGVPGIMNSTSFVIEQGVDSNNTQANNAITSVNILNGGAFYTDPTVTIIGDGEGASISLIVTAGVITGVTINNGGIGYTWATITVSENLLSSDDFMITESSDFMITEGGDFMITQNSINDGTVVISVANLEAVIGASTYYPRVALSMSWDGGHTFSNYYQQPMNRYGDYLSRVVFYDLGYGNKFTHRFMFYGSGRFVVKGGEMSVYV